MVKDNQGFKFDFTGYFNRCKLEWSKAIHKNSWFRVINFEVLDWRETGIIGLMQC